MAKNRQSLGGVTKFKTPCLARTTSHRVLSSTFVAPLKPLPIHERVVVDPKKVAWQPLRFPPEGTAAACDILNAKYRREPCLRLQATGGYFGRRYSQLSSRAMHRACLGEQSRFLTAAQFNG